MAGEQAAIWHGGFRAGLAFVDGFRLVGTPNMQGVGFPSSVKFETLKSAMIYITPLFLSVGDSGERDDTSFSK